MVTSARNQKNTQDGKVRTNPNPAIDTAQSTLKFSRLAADEYLIVDALLITRFNSYFVCTA